MNLAFLHPHWAWLLLFLPLLWWRVRPGVARAMIVLRAAIFAGIVLALMQPSLLRSTGRGAYIFVLDQKAAMTDAARVRGRQVLAERLARLPDGHRATLVQLGGTPVEAPGVRRVLIDDTRDGGSLSVALARAVDAVPLGTRASVTLLTDGLSSDRHWARSTDALIRRGIVVDVVRLDRPRRPPFIGDLAVPDARVGDAIQAVATVEGYGDGVSVALYAGAKLLAASPTLSIDGVARVPLRFTAQEGGDVPGFMPLRAVLRSAGRADAPAFAAVAAIRPPLRLLYLGGRQAGGAPRLARLLGPGFRIEAPAGVPAGVDFAAWQAVMVDDLPATRLSPALQQRLMDSVERRGIGLFYAGGEAAFGGGGYAGSPLAGGLPVTFRQEEQIERPGIALAVVIDSSGSMTGPPLELAKQLARLAVRRLTPQDQFGVVEFYGAKQWAVPMQPVRDGAAIERAIGRMQSQGASVLLPAIQEAYYGVKDAPARLKHVLVISDGGVDGGPFEQLIRHMAGEQVNLSTAMIGGQGSDITNMMQWARWGGGRFYTIAGEDSLVQLDLSMPRTTPEPAYRRSAAAVRAVPGHGWWRDIGAPVPPPVAGLVRVDVRPEAETIAATARDEPLIASWLYGRGRVTAMMTEPLGAGTRRWAAWPGYGAWLARAIARTADADTPLSIGIDRVFDAATITVRRSDGDTADRVPQVRLAGTGRPVPMEQRAPGLFVGTVAHPAGAPILVEAISGRFVARAADRAFSYIAGPRPLSVRGALPLEALAALTRDGASPATGERVADPLWGWCALAALLLYLAEIAYRRRQPRRRDIARDRPV